MAAMAEAVKSYQQYVTEELGRDISPRLVPGRPARRSLSPDALAALPGAIVTRDESGRIVAVLFRGEHAGEQDVTAEVL